MSTKPITTVSALAVTTILAMVASPDTRPQTSMRVPGLPHILDLPLELLVKSFEYLDFKSLTSLEQTCPSVLVSGP
ncbi:hypothetical protein FA95DRAFT_187532 [Auriscalpium vulgare]|uniref:Uncharacterized protein n=1 Tax=Auriscalpium vulgare TaxID=40419 RepID=A0ACB8RM47_9AGAM|nr:hypothetical protein FA95DRAFT_187532 [Auriscalpium vulgare]